MDCNQRLLDWIETLCIPSTPGTQLIHYIIFAEQKKQFLNFLQLFAESFFYTISLLFTESFLSINKAKTSYKHTSKEGKLKQTCQSVSQYISNQLVGIISPRNTRGYVNGTANSYAHRMRVTLHLNTLCWPYLQPM